MQDKIEIPNAIKDVAEQIMDEIKTKQRKPWEFAVRNAACVQPGDFYNHKSKTFLKNKRRGL